jgi:para-aminobenzoate synthetase component 1
VLTQHFCGVVLVFSILSKTLTKVSASQVLALFATVEHKHWSFLLDSCEQTHMDGRYDILVHSPCLTYQFTQGDGILAGEWCASDSRSESTKQSAFNGNTARDFATSKADSLDPSHIFDKALLSGTCPYEHLSILQNKFNQLFNLSVLENENVPFIAGALGVFSYDGNTYSDNIADANPDQYRLPEISVGFYHSSVVYDNLTQSLHVFSIYEHHIEDIIKTFDTLDNDEKAGADTKDTPHFSLLGTWSSNMTEASYRKSFSKIENYLRAGDCYQVNFAQRFHAYYQGSEWAAYCKLRLTNKAPFSAFVRLPQSTIMSLSPERFMLVKDAFVETKPIKGTRQRDTDPERDKSLAEELLHAEKDRAENLMIVDLLRNDLSKCCEPHSVLVPKLFALESYPAVHHMVSTVVGKLKSSASVYDLIKGAFPGGSITGAPKVRSMQIIQELEPDKRAIYCGTIGYIGIRGDMDTNICIRTLLAEKHTNEETGEQENNLFCWAGGGIVIDSVDTDEYLESLHKVAKILPILDINTPFKVHKKEVN